MDRDDIICEHLEYARDKHYQEADIPVYRCTRTNKEFDAFHEPCFRCKYDTSRE